MHKRTTPKIFSRAKELHRNMSPAETKLWKHLRAHQMSDVHFRNQHAIGNYVVDFSPKGTL
jgi:very-short-patch-repair endonuclease